jgi:hypothetical protein
MPDPAKGDANLGPDDALGAGSSEKNSSKWHDELFQTASDWKSTSSTVSDRNGDSKNSQPGLSSASEVSLRAGSSSDYSSMMKGFELTGQADSKTTAAHPDDSHKAARQGEVRHGEMTPDQLAREKNQAVFGIESQIKSADHTRVQQSLNEIGERVKSGELTPKQELATLKQAERLLSEKSTTSLTHEQRERLAEQVLSNAGRPTDIDQSKYNTCNVTSAEVVAYSRAPERAAKLVADVALHGEYKVAYKNPANPDEKQLASVKVDPSPHGDSLQYPTPDGMRSHASEIFQVTAVNLAYNASDGDSYRYRQIEPDPQKPWDSGERFEEKDDKGVYHPLVPGVLEPPNPANLEEVARAKSVAAAADWDNYGRNFQPNLHPAQMALAAEMITGKSSPEYLGGGQVPYSGTNEAQWTRLTRQVDSADHLKSILADAQDKGKWPLMIAVDASKEPFRSDSGASFGTDPVWHNITVHGLASRDGQEPRVLISNQWGKADDRLSWDKGIPLSQFYKAVRGDRSS